MSTGNSKPPHEDLIQALSCWSSPSIEIHPLQGGITNHNYLVSDAGQQRVVRLGSDMPEHQIMRFNEVAAGRAAHAAGLSPAIRHHEKGVLVMDYVPSECLTETSVRGEQTLGRVLDLIKRCHQDVPQYLRGASLVFWVFHVIRDYAATLKDGGSTYTDKLPGFLQLADDLEKTAGPFDIVFGHNDLLAANILDDGERLWLIDWEYAGFNTPLFDLGGLASNNGLDLHAQRDMLERYFDKPVDDQLWRKYSAMKCASLLRETLWSMVSEIHSTLDFDYSIYTAENLNRFEQSLDDYNKL